MTRFEMPLEHMSHVSRRTARAAIGSAALTGLMTLASFASGCGVKDNGTATPPTQEPPAAAPPATPTPPSSQRTLIENGAFSTSPVNLLLDPSFSLTGDQANYGAFLAIYDADSSKLTLETALDSRSPGGFSDTYARIKPADATDTQSKAVTVLTSFLGGDGPFDAQVWASKSDVSGAPAELTIGSSGLTVSVTDASPNGESFDLSPVPEMQRVAGGRTWVWLRGEVPRALPYGGFFIIHTGTGGGNFLVASPEVVAKPLADGMTVRSLDPTMTVTRRTTTSIERQAIRHYKSIPPRFVPADLKTRPGL
jgi:hypothetical protein